MKLKDVVVCRIQLLSVGTWYVIAVTFGGWFKWPFSWATWLGFWR